MPNDADKIAAATLAAAMVRRLEPTGSIQEDIRARDRAIEFASRLYRDLLAAIEATAAEEPIPDAEPVAPETA
jgi:hypothetical protein